jgi:hypothetical protein
MIEADRDHTPARGGSPDAALLHLLAQEARTWEAAKAEPDEAECDRLTETAHELAARALAMAPRTGPGAEALLRHIARSLRSGARSDGLDLAALDNVAGFLTGADGDRNAMRELEAPAAALQGATGALVLAARRGDRALAEWEGEALEYLARHARDLAETVACIVEGRPPAWRIAAPFRPLLRPGEDAA